MVKKNVERWSNGGRSILMVVREERVSEKKERGNSFVFFFIVK